MGVEAAIRKFRLSTWSVCQSAEGNQMATIMSLSMQSGIIRRVWSCGKIPYFSPLTARSLYLLWRQPNRTALNRLKSSGHLSSNNRCSCSCKSCKLVVAIPGSVLTLRTLWNRPRFSEAAFTITTRTLSIGSRNLCLPTRRAKLSIRISPPCPLACRKSWHLIITTITNCHLSPKTRPFLAINYSKDRWKSPPSRHRPLKIFIKRLTSQLPIKQLPPQIKWGNLLSKTEIVIMYYNTTRINEFNLSLQLG